MRGKLIVIEGSDGSGKATQTNLLIQKLKDQEKNVISVDFPRYGDWSAIFVEKYLNGEFGTAKSVNPFVGSIFFALDRYAASFDIKKLLEDGVNVVANRYTTSNMGHQAGKIKNKKEREKFLSWLEDLEFGIFGIPKPDLVIFLHVPAEIGQKLVEGKGHRDYIGGDKKDLHEKDINHLKEAEEAYLEIAEKYGWEKIECVKNGKLLSKAEISKGVWKVVEKFV